MAVVRPERLAAGAGGAGSRGARSVAIAKVGATVAPACGCWVGGLGLEQADAEEPAVLVDALDHVPVELELADDDGGKVNPRRATDRASSAVRPRAVVAQASAVVGFQRAPSTRFLGPFSRAKQLSSAPAPWSPAWVNRGNSSWAGDCTTIRGLLGEREPRGVARPRLRHLGEGPAAERPVTAVIRPSFYTAAARHVPVPLDASAQRSSPLRRLQTGTRIKLFGQGQTRQQAAQA